jgi:chemotaxis response regulator CheB
MKKTKILLIEDNRILRDGIKALLTAQADLRVVAVSGAHRDTLLQARTMKPHVVLIDVGLRNENGLRIVSTLARELPQIRVIGMGLMPTQRDTTAGSATLVKTNRSLFSRSWDRPNRTEECSDVHVHPAWARSHQLKPTRYSLKRNRPEGPKRAQSFAHFRRSVHLPDGLPLLSGFGAISGGSPSMISAFILFLSLPEYTSMQ